MSYKQYKNFGMNFPSKKNTFNEWWSRLHPGIQIATNIHLSSSCFMVSLNNLSTFIVLQPT